MYYGVSWKMKFLKWTAKSSEAIVSEPVLHEDFKYAMQ